MNDTSELHPDKVKNFAISMILDAFSQSKEEEAETRNRIRMAIAKTLNTILQIEQSGDNHIKTGVEGIIEGVLVQKRGYIDILQSQKDFLQAKLNYEKQQLDDEISLVIEELQNVSKVQPDKVRKVIDRAITETNCSL